MTKKSKKKGSASRGSAGLRPKKKPFRVKFGAYYKTRRGFTVGPTIKVVHGWMKTHPYWIDGLGSFTSEGIWSDKGEESGTDLVREVKTAKRSPSVARGTKTRNTKPRRNK